jgi:hypothetical protein
MIEVIKRYSESEDFTDENGRWVRKVLFNGLYIASVTGLNLQRYNGPELYDKIYPYYPLVFTHEAATTIVAYNFITNFPVSGFDFPYGVGTFKTYAEAEDEVVRLFMEFKAKIN